MLFISTQEMDIYDNFGKSATIVGQIGRGQEINTVGAPIEADGWVWHQVQGGGLWVQERTTDDKIILLSQPGTEPALAQPAPPNPIRVFVTTVKVIVRDAPAFSGKTLGETSANQKISVEGDPVTADGFIWHKVVGAELWLPEKDTAGKNVMMVSQESEEAEQKLEEAAQKTPARPIQPTTERPVLGENIDIDPADYERTKRAAYNITRAFEGGGFASYNNYDRGIVSYGIMQFTLGSGSLGRVIKEYLTASTSATARALQNEYATRVANREASLRDDMRFKDLLTAAASETEMQAAQYKVADEDYWDIVMKYYVQRRGNLKYPLTYALLFDMGIHFGVNHPYARYAEESYGVPSNSRVGDNGITEEQLTTRIAELRRDAHYRQADKTGFGGLRVRGDFWVRITGEGDWYLQGNNEGIVYPKSGRPVQVRNPF